MSFPCTLPSPPNKLFIIQGRAQSGSSALYALALSTQQGRLTSTYTPSSAGGHGREKCSSAMGVTPRFGACAAEKNSKKRRLQLLSQDRVSASNSATQSVQTRSPRKLSRFPGS